MDEILKMTVNEMPGTVFDCSCGRRHSFPVQKMSIRKGAIEDLPAMAEPFKEGRVLVVFDNNTYKVAGAKAVELLRENGFKIKELLFDKGSDILIPDSATIGRILQEQDKDITLMLAVGSGVINDSVKYVSSRTKVPYIVVATAPSMDGYVSDGSPNIVGGVKISLEADLTYGLIGDYDILATAPQELIEAGFGDMIGKITALADWDLAVRMNGDYRCDTCVKLTERALDLTYRGADGIKERDPQALGDLLEALTLTGVAMALINISRPASGAEHLLSHIWEMDYIARGLNPIHHGVQVGAATPVILRLYEEMQDVIPAETMALCPGSKAVTALLRKAGAAASPAEIGISRELFHHSLAKGHAFRDRYTILKLVEANGRSEELADKLTEEFYGA